MTDSRVGMLKRTFLVGLVVLTGSGCYVSRPLPVGAVPPSAGERVRVHLTPAGAVRLAEASGRTERVLQGTLQEEPRDVLIVAVPSVQEGRSMADTRLRQVVVIPMADVQELRIRKFSAGRTGLLAAGGAALAYALARVAFGLTDDDGAGPQPPPDEAPLTFGWRFTVR